MHTRKKTKRRTTILSVLIVALTPLVAVGLAFGTEGTASAMPFTGSLTCTPSVTGVLFPPRYNTAPPTAVSHYLFGGSVSGSSCTVTQGGWMITGGIVREVAETAQKRNCTRVSPSPSLKIDIFWEATPVSTTATSATYPAPSVVTLTGGIHTVIGGADVETWTTGTVTGSFAPGPPSLTANFDQLVTQQQAECALPSGWYYSSWTGSGPNGASTITV